MISQDGHISYTEHKCYTYITLKLSILNFCFKILWQTSMLYAASDFSLFLSVPETETNEEDAESIPVTVIISRNDGMPIQLDTIVAVPILVTDVDTSKHDL